jgi:hypothetical protein
MGEQVVNIVDSPDGTPIAFDRSGAGDPLILVSGALFPRPRHAGHDVGQRVLAARSEGLEP